MYASLEEKLSVRPVSWSSIPPEWSIKPMGWSIASGERKDQISSASCCYCRCWVCNVSDNDLARDNVSQPDLPSYWLYAELVRLSTVNLVHESIASHLAGASDRWPPVQNMCRKRWSVSECIKRVNNTPVAVNTEHGPMICVTIVWLRIVEFHKINPMIGTGGAPASVHPSRKGSRKC